MTSTSSPLSRDEGRRRIDQEDQLVNHRFSWLVGSQAFLLTTFVLLRNNPSFYLRESANPSLPDAFVARTDLLVYLVAVVGILISVCSFLGVLAAFMAIASWRARVHPSDQKHMTSNPIWNFLGGLAAFLPGPVITSVWVLLLSAEWDYLRLSTTQILTPLIVGTVTLLLWVLYTIYAFVVRVRW